MQMDGYNKAYAYILKQREKAPICLVCKKKLFDYNDCLDIYFRNRGNIGTMNMDDVGKVYRRMFQEYPYRSEDTGFRTKHHVNYMLDITINVCSSCHSKIHNSNEEKYKKFKPYDKRKPFNPR